MKGKLKKRLKYLLFLLIIIPLTIELSPYVLSPVIYKQSFSRKNLKSELLRQYEKQVEKDVKSSKNESENESENEYLGEHILHPYFGFINVPNESYNRFYFQGTDPITHKSADTVNLCLTGGSVALGLYNTSRNRIIEGLKASKYFKDKEIRIVLFALGGFKQPQQLFLSKQVALKEEQAELWQRSSTMIGNIGKAVGFDYFHFLQPNQYYQNSKELNKEELTIAFEHQPFA